MVPRATEILTGSVGEMSLSSSVGDSLTAATGAGSTVDDADLDEVLLLEERVGPADEVRSAAVSLAVLTCAVPLCSTESPVDEPEQPATAISTPAAIRATAERLAALERCGCVWSSGDRQRPRMPRRN